MKLLLLGADGQVGWELRRALAPLGKVTALGRGGGDGLCGDLAAPERVTATIRREAPDVIVNAAAYTAVDRAESEPAVAHTVNAEAPGVLAREAQRNGTWLVHYSTDYVFDGSGQRPWREEDPPAPLSVYGRTKHEGEIAVQRSGCKHLVFRTSWVYAARGRNFIRIMLRLAAERETLQVIDDQHGAPTGAALIADATAHALRSLMTQSSGRNGVYHLAASGETTWHGYACWLIEHARAAGWPVRLADGGLEAVPTEKFPVQATRPRNSRLDCTLLESVFGLSMPDWRDGVSQVVSELLTCERYGDNG